MSSSRAQNKTPIVVIVIALIVVVIILGVVLTKVGRNGGSGNGGGGGGDNGSIIDGQREAWQAISVPGAKCGNGEEYVIGFSAGPAKINGKANSRLVIWLPGGGSTMITKDDEFTTNVGFDLGLITPIKQFAEETSFMFLDHPDNDLFVKDANWVILPYCTQDFHSGTLTEPIEYDFTGETGMVKAYERILNDGKINLDKVERNYPFIRTETHEENGKIVIDKLYISILHDGAKNVEFGLDKMFEELDKRNFDLDRAEIVMAGSSAGSFGTWYNAWRIGDLLYTHPGAKFTMVPESGSPTTRVWNGQDIAVNSEQVESMEYRLSYYNNIDPCDKNGGNYRGGGDCRDTLDLIEHYQNRWKGMDLQIMPVVNKEDLVAVTGLGDQNDPGFDAKLLNLCQSIHRYAQYVSKQDNTFVYAAWLYVDKGSRETRVHGFKNSILTVKMISPNGKQADEYGVLKMINDVAARELDWPVQTPHIENTLGVITNPTADDSSVTPRPSYLQECNVAWPNGKRPN